MKRHCLTCVKSSDKGKNTDMQKRAGEYKLKSLASVNGWLKNRLDTIEGDGEGRAGLCDCAGEDGGGEGGSDEG